MITPQVALAGILEPAYGVAGDSFDYAINDNVVHLAVIDAMGHGLNGGVQEMVRGLSHSLVQARGGVTTDDATLFLVEWRGGAADHSAAVDV